MVTGTSTSGFGASKRENHDSSVFYNTRIHKGNVLLSKPDGIENDVPNAILNKVIRADSQNLSFIPEKSIHLVVTSPPYNASKDYDEDLTLVEYLRLLKNVFTECYDKLVSGGRLCVNLANIGRKPYFPLTDYLSQILSGIGYIQRGEIIWDKGASAGTSTAWGSWKSSSNPCLRDVHEYILVFSKETNKRNKGNKHDTITKDEFLEFTKSIWSFPTASAKKVGHPAPFPEELVYRCIQLFSFVNDVVLDPFIGSGTTAISALKSNRNFIGVELNQSYIDLAERRIAEYTEIR